jgi:hypothetical protein|tara:strand:+ start:424 stop:597 length:174 start_codon:yes stop_codon:yes gene_type:complete
MPEKKKVKKNSCCKKTSDKIDIIYEVLSVHEVALKELEKKVDAISEIVNRVKGRMGL